MPEAEVVPHEHGHRRADLFKRVQKSVRLDVEDVAVGRQRDDGSAREPGEHLEAFLVFEKLAKRLVVLAEDLVGVFLEREHDKCDPALFRGIRRLGEQSPMPQVQAVEDADCDHRAPQRDGVVQQRVPTDDVLRPVRHRQHPRG